MELRTLPLILLLISNICPGQTQERLKAVVKTERDIYETVTVRCEIPGDEDDWTYRWFIDGSSRPFGTDRAFNFRSDESQKHSSVTCRGQRKSDGQRSEISDSVTLALSIPETEKPKAVLTVQHETSLILRGETVTLTCDVQGEGWTYRVKCGDDGYYTSKEKEFEITVNITQECVCDGCRGSDCSDWSVEVTLTVSERPKAVLTVQPDPSLILRGETVTLTCHIQGEGWTYRVKCGDDIKHDEDDDEKEFKITPEITRKCQCYGCRGSVCSQWSDGVTLTVSDKPRVTVTPQRSVFTGDTVTLSCDVRHSTGRGIIWYKNFKIINSSDETVTLRDVRVSDGGDYGCAFQGELQGPRVMLTVRERPRAVLRVQPDGRVFRGQTVTLTCDIQETDGTSWTYSWTKDHSEIHVSQSQEFTISYFSESHTGHYSCRGRETRGSRYTHTSDEATLTLSVPEAPLPVTPMVSVPERPKAVLTVQPDPSLILRGEIVTLTCHIQGEGWTYRVKCGDDGYYTSKEKEFNITANITQECVCDGCRGSVCSQWSDEVTLTVSDSDAPLPVLSVLKLLSFLLAASPYLLVTIIIGVKYYRAHAQSDEINQFAVTEE